jgi:1-deoxy-D-xylulose-5-phosphate synthase
MFYLELCAPFPQVLLHIKTEKGMGYPPAMAASDKMHGVAKFDVATGKQFKGKGGGPLSLTSVFANELVKLAEDDPTVHAATFTHARARARTRRGV